MNSGTTVTTTQQPGSAPAVASLSVRKLIAAVFAIGLPTALWFAPLRMDLTEKHALAIASFMIIAWITEVLPHAVTGIIGCYLFWVLKAASNPTTFSTQNK